MRKVLCSLLVAGCLLAVLPGFLQAQTPGEIIPGRFLVTFRSNVTAPVAVAQELSRAHGFTVRHVYRFAVRGMAIEVPGRAPDKILNALRRDPRVRSVGPDRYLAAFAPQTVPKGIDRINAEPGLGANTGSGIRAAIVDTGLDFAHPDLNVDEANSRNCIGSLFLFCGPGGDDDNGHGTFVGGIVAALNNGIDVVGVGPEIILVSIKVLDSNGSGSFADVIAGLDHLSALNDLGIPIGVANMSLGATCSVCTDDSTDPVIDLFHQAVQALVSRGTTVVVAAGNAGADATFTVPASFDEVVTVSALTDTDGQPGGNGNSFILPGLGKFDDDTFAKFSNRGADIDVIAPGVSETSLKLGGGTTSGSGTSFSSPHAAGVAALFIRDQLDKGQPSPSPGIVRQALIETGECHEGGGLIFYGTTGCSEVWPKDPDGIPEPLVRADNIAIFGGPTPANDVAVTSVSAPSPVLLNSTESVNVGVANEGTEQETFTVSLSDSLSATISDPQSVTLAAGASTARTFSWTPTITGDHVLTATASTVTGETDTADNSKSTTVSVLEPTHDVAVTAISAPSSVVQGDTANISVDVANQGTFDETFTVSVTGTAGTVSGAQSVTLTAGASTTLAFTWDTTGASTGDHTLTATASTVTGETDTADNSRSTTSTVTEPSAALSVTGILPDTMQAGTTIDVTISGTGFVAGASVIFENGSGPAPTASNVVVVGANTITATVTAKSGGPPRNRVWDVVVTNPDGSSARLAGGFTVTR